MRINSISTKKAPRNSQLGCFGELFLIDSYLFDLQICVTSCRRCTPEGMQERHRPLHFCRTPVRTAACLPASPRGLLLLFPSMPWASRRLRCFIARIASSAGIGLRMPASASCAATRAPATPAALRWMQGISTRPATGSHTRPNTLPREMDTASPSISGVPPHNSTRAAAAMAAALPALGLTAALRARNARIVCNHHTNR